MSENPDAIRSDIEATRARLGTNVDAVADKVTPSNIVHRQTDKVRDAVFGVKEKVMGAMEKHRDHKKHEAKKHHAKKDGHEHKMHKELEAMHKRHHKEHMAHHKKYHG